MPKSRTKLAAVVAAPPAPARIDEEAALERMASDLSSHPAFADCPPTLALAEGILTVEGEVPDLRTKKLLLEALAAQPPVEFVIDRLRVVAAVTMGDAAIRDRVVATLLGDTTFDECALDVLDGGAFHRVREARPVGAAKGTIRLAVTDGVVTLDGTVPSRNHARLATALAWWVPGTRDVQDFLGARQPEPFDDLDLVDGVLLVLEKDPLVDAGQIGVSAKDTVVTLSGTVKSALERNAAEHDAWFVPDVGNVVNGIEVVG